MTDWQFLKHKQLQSEEIEKIFQEMFNDKGLDIVISCNRKIVNYLDLTLNLNA